MKNEQINWKRIVEQSQEIDLIDTLFVEQTMNKIYAVKKTRVFLKLIKWFFSAVAIVLFCLYYLPFFVKYFIALSQFLYKQYLINLAFPSVFSTPSFILFGLSIITILYYLFKEELQTI